MVPALILAIIVLCFVLIKSADWIIIALRRIAKTSKTGVFILSSLILAIGTSFPELSVGITSSLEKSSALALGVVLGSNIVNISLVAGLAALFAGRVYVHGGFIKKELGVAFLAGLAPLFLILDGSLNRVDGLILLAIYGAYASSFFKQRYEQISKEHREESFIYRFLRKFTHINGKTTREYGRLFIGIALLLFSADMIVKIATQLAESVGIPIFVIGLILLAIGTSLPEVVFSFRSLEDHEPSMFFGNILGSTIANSTLIVGISALIYPIVVFDPNEYLLAGGVYIVIAILFWYFVRSKMRLERWEAGVLVIIYILFATAEFIW